MLVDTHCHIHDADYPLDAEDVLCRAHDAGVGKMICVGTSEQSSANAIAFAKLHEGVFASIGVHPHDAKDGYGKISLLADTASSFPVSLKHTSAHHDERSVVSLSPAEPGNNEVARLEQKLVAVGEIGLDYFYTHSPREVQMKALEAQIQIALDYNLPVIFHVREAFEDFWPIFDNFRGIRGELHSFTDTTINLEEGLKRGLFIGVNGISTFTKDPAQKAMFAAIPLERMLLETDAPFLTPAPKRGNINEPALVGLVARMHADARSISQDELANATTANAAMLFGV